MRLFIDTDVLLDIALRREPFYKESCLLLDRFESRPGSIAVSWHGVANLIYMLKGDAGPFIQELLEFAEIPRTGTEHMQFALDLKFADLEDAMQVAAAQLFNAQAIITRNTTDYKCSPIKVMTPEQYLKSM